MDPSLLVLAASIMLRELLRLENCECISRLSRVLVCCKLVRVVEKAGFNFLELLSGSKVVVAKAGVRFPEKSKLIPSIQVGDSLPKALKSVFFVFSKSYLRRGFVSNSGGSSLLADLSSSKRRATSLMSLIREE